MGVGLFVGVWVARYLGPEQFGVFSYALAFVTLFSAFASLGLDGLVVRDIVNDPSMETEIIGSSFMLKLAGALITVVLSVGSIIILRPNDRMMYWLVGIIASGAIFQAFDTIDFYFQARIQSKYSVFARNGAFLIVSLCKIFLILMRAPLIAFAATVLAEVVLGSIGLIIGYRIKGHHLKDWVIAKDRIIYLMKNAWPLFLSGIVIMIYMRIDQVMIGELSTSKEVGIYSAAVRLVEVWYVIPTVIAMSLFPVIIDSKKLDIKIYMSRMQSFYDLMIWLSIVVAAGITIFSKVIIELLFGQDFAGAGPVLALQGWISTILFFNIARGRWLLAEGLTKDIMIINVSAVVLNVIANIFLIPEYGAVGASIASLITAFGANIIVSAYSNPVRLSMKMYFIGILFPFRFALKNLR